MPPPLHMATPLQLTSMMHVIHSSTPRNPRSNISVSCHTSPIFTTEYPRYQHEQVMTCQMKISEVSRKKHKDDHSPNSLSLSLSLSLSCDI